VQNLTQFAATNGNIFTSLGIDWKSLILQIVAFLLLVAILGKWVYPWLMKSVDERQRGIEEANKAAEGAKDAAEKAEEKMESLLSEARKQAADIVATARQESATALSAAEEKARKRTEQILKDAQDEISKDVIAAKKTLHDETLSLVGLATEKVLGKVVSKDIDQKLIKESLEEVA
jgi:F-type H+-transporting ATPase subunit b